MKENKVLVLLSTYNGEKYLEMLIDSILKQKCVNVSILVRDDGSTDDTLKILKKYKENDNRIEYYSGKNLGYAHSFWNLLKKSNNEYEYYAFCDQDDIWEEEKLKAAIDKIDEINEDIPILYTSNVICVDDNLNELEEKAFLCEGTLNNYETFQKSILPGCTFVFNNLAKSVASRYDGFLESHDWAIYSIVTTFGKVIYDDKSYIKYRLHSGNAIGIEDKKDDIKRKIKRFFSKSKCTRSRYAKDFYNCYKDLLNDDLKKDIECLGFYKENLRLKFRLIFSNKFKGTIFKILVMFNKV